MACKRCPAAAQKWGASQFLSRRSVPKEQSEIAPHFNAGKGLEKSSPAGTAEKNRRFQPSLWDWMAIPSDLGILNVLNAHEMPGRHPAFQWLCRGAPKFDFPIRPPSDSQ
jgi:hypothetical protein